MPKIVVTAYPGGEVKVEADGFKGKSCTQETADIEAALGLETKKRTLKREYYAPAQQTKQKA